MECKEDQKGPVYLEKMTMQDYVNQAIDRCKSEMDPTGSLSAALGLLNRMFKYNDPTVFGDLLFYLFMASKGLGYNANDLLCEAVVRYEKRCNERAKQKTQGTPSSKPCVGCGVITYTPEGSDGLCPRCYRVRKGLAGYEGDYVGGNNAK
jgi:hypothetical protein